MGTCSSIIRYEDDEDIQIRKRNKQHARELQEFQKQLRLQKCFSELDMNGRGTSRKKKATERVG